ncbi:MAG: DUF4302 domain-containing protein [Marinifilum sp.]|jgi:hypothetical protein|nr:DUF4302 domain-containing protein [Marinifilum sp.]
MKKNLLYLLLFIGALFVACDDNDAEYIFDKSINERFEELKTEYNTKLKAPENGWFGYYNPNEEAGEFSLLLKFGDDGKVIMHSDYNAGTANDTITYQIVKKQDITLVFESWSVLHAIYETENNNFGGEYVFNISEVSDDEIKLTSKTDNGYGDDEVTELILKPATKENWNLKPVYNNVARLAGDPSKSVFRNLKSGDSPVAAFSYDAVKRLAKISYMEGSTIKRVSAPLKFTPEGFCLIKAIEIGGESIECFDYDSDKDSFVEKKSGVSIVYDMVPGIPLAPYDFGKRPNARYNTLDKNNKSSLAFRNFLSGYGKLVKSDITIDRIYFYDLGKKDKVPYLYIYTNKGKFWFDINYEIKDDGKLYITLTGDTNVGGLAPLLKPLIDLFANKKGHYIEGTGTLERYTNKTFSLINADDPSLRINFYEWG